MSSVRPEDIRLRDPLSRVTRNERRALLALSAAGIVIAKTGLVPSKISALGIEFSQADQKSLLRVFAIIVIYFLVGFFIYAASDFVAWRIAYQSTWAEKLSNNRRSKDKKGVENELANNWLFMLHDLWVGASFPISFIRAVFEFVVPFVIGIIAVIMLLRS